MASAPEKIRAALLRVEQKFDKLRRHAKHLEWNLKNAEALGNLAGWVGFYCAKDGKSQKCVFPVAKNEGRRIADPAFTTRHHYKTNEVVLYGMAAPIATVAIDTTATGEIWWGYIYHLGFFSTRREARDFVKAREAELAVKEP